MQFSHYPSRKFPEPHHPSSHCDKKNLYFLLHQQTTALRKGLFNMASDQKASEVIQDPSEFFETIGSKVAHLNPTTNGDATNDDRKLVEEIESLCMNCHENVSRTASRLGRIICTRTVLTMLA